MKEELQGKLVEILTSIQTATGKASDFALAQLPDIAQSYVLYERVASVVTLMLAAAVMTLCVWRFLWNARNPDWDKSYEHVKAREFSQVAVMAGCAMGTVIGALVFVVTIHQALLVWIAPKVWLLKELAGMLK